jgi:iron complex outermembrane receptor protein
MQTSWKIKATLAALFGACAAFTLQAQTATTTTTTTTTTGDSASVPADQSNPQVLAKFVVTGSNIEDAGSALSIPVAVLSPADIQNSGVETNVLDVLRKISPAISGLGGENATTAGGATNGGSQITLHNLPTLVLVNGRRLAYDPVDGSGGSEFVDLNTIPLAAIDKIEVLSDGSSAIYGADALGGVVNIILKKDYNGWEADAHYGFSDLPGHYSERTGSLTGGVSNGTTSITTSFEYTQSDPIFENERPETNPYYGTTTFPGILEVFGLASGYDEAFQLAPGVNAPPGGGNYTIQQLVAMGIYKDLGSFNDPNVITGIQHQLNLAAKQNLIESSKRESATINVSHKIYGDSLEGFGYILYSHVDTQYGLNAQPLFPYISTPNSDLAIYGSPTVPPGNEYVPVTAPTNPLSQASLDQGFTDGSGGQGALVHNRFIPDPRLFQDDGESFTGVAGLRGTINADWSWEVAANFNRYTDDYTNPGVLDENNLIAAFVTGQVNPFAINQAPGALNGILGTAFVDYISTNNTFDALLRGALFELPAGKVKFAAGIEYSRQNLTAIPDNNTANNLWIDSPTVLPFNSNRTITSYYAEVEIPLVDKSRPLPGVYAATLGAAGRYDEYSGGVGSSRVPKVDLKYQPFDDQLTLRASAGESFIAPPLYALYGPTTQGSSSQLSYTGSNGTSYTNVQMQAVSGSNPNLKPSTASTWETGFTFTPKAVPNLSVTFDYFDTTQHKVVGSIDESTIVQSVEDLGAASPYASFIRFGTPTGPGPSGDAPGQISSRPLASVYIIDPELNLSSVAIKGYDAAVTYVIPTSHFGRFEVDEALTVYDSYLIQVLPQQNYFQNAGHIDQVAAAISATPSEGGTTPRYKSYTSLKWSERGVDLLAAFTFVPGVTDIGSGGVNESPALPVASYAQWDFAAAYNLSALHLDHWLDGATVRVGVNNAFNYVPPIAPYQLENTRSDISAYDGGIGRMFFVDLSYKF